MCKACAAISPPPQLKCQHRMLPSVLSLPLPNVPDSLSELLSSLGARACGIMPPVFTHGPIMSDARDALTGEARSFLLGLLQPDPRCRLGRQTPISQRARPRPQLQSQSWLARDVRGHAFLSRLSWQVVESKQCAPPFDRTVQARPRCSRCERRARHMQRDPRREALAVLTVCSVQLDEMAEETRGMQLQGLLAGARAFTRERRAGKR